MSSNTNTQPARERLTKLFEFLKAYTDLRYPPVRDIAQQPYSLWLNDIPSHPSVELFRDSGKSDDEAECDVVLRLTRPIITQCPLPPTALSSWLKPGWQELSGKVEVQPTRNTVGKDVVGNGRRLAIECDGEQFHGSEKLQEDLERQAILERLGWTFARIRGSLFFRDEVRALEPVFRRLAEMNITPEFVADGSSSSPQQSDMVERVICRAQQLRTEWHAETSEVNLDSTTAEWLDNMIDERPTATLLQWCPDPKKAPIVANQGEPITARTHELDPQNPGDLRFTKIVEGRIGCESAVGWNDLVKSGLKLAIARGFSLEDLKNKLTVNLKSGAYEKEGYRYDPVLKLSIQGFDTKKAADNLYRLARILTEMLYIKFVWRDQEEAAHPGEEGVIRWLP